MQKLREAEPTPKTSRYIIKGAPSLSPLEITPGLAYAFPTVDSLENFCDGFANMEA